MRGRRGRVWGRVAEKEGEFPLLVLQDRAAPLCKSRSPGAGWLGRWMALEVGFGAPARQSLLTRLQFHRNRGMRRGSPPTGIPTAEEGCLLSASDLRICFDVCFSEPGDGVLRRFPFYRPGNETTSNLGSLSDPPTLPGLLILNPSGSTAEPCL